MSKRFELGKINVEKRMNVVLLEVKKATRSLNENKNSLRTQRELLSLVREYKSLYKTQLGFRCLTEAWFSSLRRNVEPTGSRKPIPRSAVKEFDLAEKQEEIAYLKDFLKKVVRINSDNSIGEHAQTMMNLLSAAEKDFDSVNDYDGAEKLGTVLLFFKQYAELFGKNLRFVTEENVADPKVMKKVLDVLRKAFPNEIINVTNLVDDAHALLRNIDYLSQLHPGGGRAGEVLKKIDLSSAHKSVFSHLKDMFSSIGGSPMSGMRIR